MAAASLPSSFLSHDTWEPTPTGTPTQITSAIPPSVLPSAFAGVYSRNHLFLGAGHPKCARATRRRLR